MVFFFFFGFTFRPQIQLCRWSFLESGRLHIQCHKCTKRDLPLYLVKIHLSAAIDDTHTTTPNALQKWKIIDDWKKQPQQQQLEYTSVWSASILIRIHVLSLDRTVALVILFAFFVLFIRSLVWSPLSFTRHVHLCLSHSSINSTYSLPFATFRTYRVVNVNWF